MNEPLLRVESIDFYYGDVQILHDLSLELNPNEIVTILGANGAGKTTVIRAICNMAPIRKGAIYYKGKRLDTVPSYKLAGMGISLIPEGRHLFPAMTVIDNLRLGGYSLKDKKQVEKNIDWVCELFPRLKERKKQLAGTLSGGEQQMCAIARGLITNPELIIFDEPSLGLAPNLVDDIFETLKFLVTDNNASILLVEQNAETALEISNRGFVLENGHIVMSGSSQELLNSREIQKAYLGI